MTLTFHPVELKCDQCQTIHMLEEGVDFVGYYQLFGLIEQLGWIKHWNKELNGYMHLCPECQLAHIERFKKIKEKAEREMYSIAEAPDQLSPTK